MRVPTSIPELALRTFTKKITPEQVEEERLKRKLVSQDANWDEANEGLNCTLVNLCLKVLETSYPDLVRKIQEGNRILKFNYELQRDQWRKAVNQYKKDLRIYKEEYEEFQKRFNEFYTIQENGQTSEEYDPSDLEPPIEPIKPPHHSVPREKMKPLLQKLTTSNRLQFLEEVDPTTIPMSIALRTIKDQIYWKRLCEEEFPDLIIEEFGNCWKRAYVETILRQAIEFFHPYEGDMTELTKTLKRFGPFAKKLEIEHLIPISFGYERKKPAGYVRSADDDMGGEEDDGLADSEHLKKLKAERWKERTKTPEEALEEDAVAFMRSDNSHIDFSFIFPFLKHLSKLSLQYKMQQIGLDYEPRFCQFTDTDCKLLAKGLAECTTLHDFALQDSRVSPEQVQTLCRDGFIRMQHLRSLNLSYNNVGNSGAKALARIISDDDSHIKYTLHSLILTSCSIKRKGAKAIAYGLSLNAHLKYLCLRLNPIHDTGGRAIANALVEHPSLVRLDVSGTSIGDPSCRQLGKMLLHNQQLREVNLSSNKGITNEGASYIETAIVEKGLLYRTDLRQTSIDMELSHSIIKALRSNLFTSKFQSSIHGVQFPHTESARPKKKKKQLNDDIEEEDDQCEEDEDECEDEGEDDEYEDEDEIIVIKAPAKNQLGGLGATSKINLDISRRAQRTHMTEFLIRRMLAGNNEMNIDENMTLDPCLRGKQLEQFIEELEQRVIPKTKVIKMKRINWRYKCAPPKQPKKFRFLAY